MGQNKFEINKTESIVKKRLIELKQKKDNQLLESKILENRLRFIFESHVNGKSLQNLPTNTKKKLIHSIIQEINFRNEYGLIKENEDLNQLLTNLFGNTFQTMAKSIVEPLMNSILKRIGISGSILTDTINNFVGDNSKLFEMFKSCESMTNIIAQSVQNSMIEDIRKNTTSDGLGNSFIKNHLVDTLRGDDKFLNGLIEKLSPIVCEIYNKYLERTKRIETAIKEPMV